MEIKHEVVLKLYEKGHIEYFSGRKMWLFLDTIPILGITRNDHILFWILIVNSLKSIFERKRVLKANFTVNNNGIRDTILSKLSWTYHRTIFSQCKTDAEREFYLRLNINENFSVKELDRQISASLFERTMMGNSKLSTATRDIYTNVTNLFKNSYVFSFLNLPEPSSESDLQKGLIEQMKKFIPELSKDFLFIGETSRNMT